MAANVQSMCQYWKNFDLQELQKDLDITATDLANRQDESDISRKRLVEQSRDFKKNTPEDIRRVVAPLLRSFQTEVDALSKRSKAAEAAFLTVYKKLIDMPDPVPALEHALLIQKRAQKVQDLEIENKQLRETLDEYNHEFAEVKNQEVTIKQLKEKLKEHEEKMEANADARAKEKEKEVQKTFAEKERHLQETQLSIAKKLGEAEQQVTTLRSALESVQSELFDVKSKYDEATAAKSDEMEMVMADLERANERASASEREVEQLQQQLLSATQNLQQVEQMQKAPNMEHALDILKRSSLEVELAAKEKEITQLVEDVQRLQASLNKLRDSTTSQIAKLEEELTNKAKAFKLLEEKLKSQEDYEEVKRELNILKSIEFSKTSEGDQTHSKSLELLLLEKNKTLQTENMQVKMANNDVGGSSAPLSNTDAFATLLGEEIVATYRQQNQSGSSTPTTNGLPLAEKSSTTATTTAATTTITTTTTTNHVSYSSNDSCHMPPPSPFYSYGNGHHYNIPSVAMVKQESSKNQALDTALVAKTVRELLSVHNIGQRLFAKHVLGLSQGTVSELLSKPKSWDKLTEKGRESYRKMHAWAVDDRNILALKAISPKKGSQTLIPSIQREDSATEEKIAQILSDAQHAMRVKKNMEQQVGGMSSNTYKQEQSKINTPSSKQHTSSTSANGVPTTCSAGKTSPSSVSSRRSSDIERSPKIPQTSSKESELAAQEMVTRIYREELTKLAQAAETAGNVAASTMYQHELARLAQNIHKTGLHYEKMHNNQMDNFHDSVSIKLEPPDCTSDSSSSQTNNGPIDLSKPHSVSQTPTEMPFTDTARHAGSAFCLVRPRLNGHDSYESQRFSYMPSDCLSPLQRMQNIANSLTSRSHVGMPSSKPLRAVLPPITQEEFDKYSNVNTDELVKEVKETLSQYSISQRLFGENVLGLSQGSVSDLLARPKPWHMLTQKGREPFIRMQIFLEDAEAIPKLVASQYRIPPDKLMRNNSQSQDCSPDTTADQPCQMAPLHSPHPNKMHYEHAWGSVGSYPTSMFEIAAMTSDIDTLEVTSKVKEVLQFHNLGQRLFGEAVIGLSQGSVSELLSKPKPWHMLSIKGREPFIKMHLWLSDSQNIDRLKRYQNELKAAKRRRGSVDERCFDPPATPKRPRIFFTEEQKDILRQAYAQDPYPNQSTIECLANELNVGVKTVINWFHNHRMRAKQQQHPSNSSHSDSHVSFKTEPNEDSSNHSESSIMSVETSGQDSGAIYKGGETSQWMFPKFEPMQRKASREELCESTEGKVEVRDEGSSSGSEKERACSTQHCSGLSGVNKRKRGNPQWVFEGTQLDKTQSYGSSFSSTDNEENSAHLSENGIKLIHERASKIQKLQKRISMADEDWEEFDRSASIEKIQRNISTEQDEDWEF